MLTPSAYVFPFAAAVSEPPLFAGSDELTLRITLKSPSDAQEAVPLLTLRLAQFATLAFTGALGVLPAPDFDPGVALFQSVDVQADEVSWKFQGWPARDDSVTLLMQLFLTEEVRDLIARVALVRASLPATRVIQSDPQAFYTYPRISPSLPFKSRILHDGRDEFELHLRLAKPPTPEITAEITNTLILWAGAAAWGSYGVAPVDPLKCMFQFDEHCDVVDNELTWGMWRFLAHPLALEGLVNVCGKIHARVAAVTDCEVD